MTKKAQTPAVQTGNTDPNTLQLHKDPAQTDATQIAAMALGSVAANAMTARTFAKGTGTARHAGEHIAGGRGESLGLRFGRHPAVPHAQKKAPV